MDPTSLDVPALEALVRHHNALYWDQAKPEIPDYEYDALVARLRELAPDSPVLSAMGPSVSPALGASVKHRHRMLSLDKCYAIEDLVKWAGDFEGDAIVSPKFDGVACTLRYDDRGKLASAATRGDGEVGEDITVNARSIREIPGRVNAREIEVRGEIYMRLSVFAKFREEGFSNPRNLTAGAVKQKNAAKSADYRLSFAAYDVLGTDLATEHEKMDHLEQLGFARVERHVVSHDDLARGYEAFAAARPTLDFEIDGVVYKADRVSEQRRLGVTAHHPRYAIAYKFQGDSGTTRLREIEWSVARSGAITPVGVIDAVTLSGASVARASLHNAGYIAKLGLTRDSEVVVMRRGGVIPNVEFVSKPGEGAFALPETCPSCGKPVRVDKDFLYCSKPSDCRNAIIGQLAHFAATVGMLGFGDVILAQSYDRGLLRAPADFYALTLEGLLTLDRVADKGARKLLAEVDKARTLDLGVFLRAFGLPEVGRNVSTLLAERFATLDAVLAVTEEDLAAIHSIGDVIAKTVVRSLADARAMMETVSACVTLTVPAVVHAGEGPWKGVSFVFTGKMATLERKAAEAIVRELGGTALDAVSKALNVLVVGDKKTDEKSAKQKAAEKLVAKGETIEVISESEFLARVERARTGT